jgi:hypothetical protein
MNFGFIYHLYTRLGTTSNYSAIADFHTLQIFSNRSVCTSGCLVIASNNASGLKSSLNGGFLPTDHFSSQISAQDSLGCPNFLPYHSSARTTAENTVSNSNCIVACVSVFIESSRNECFCSSTVLGLSKYAAVWTSYIWFRIGASSGFLWTQEHCTQPAERQSAI